MRIPHRSVAVLSSSTASTSWETTCTSNSTGHGDEEEEKAKRDFLFPLLMAAMDAQAEAEVSESLIRQPTPFSEIESGIRRRKQSAHNWRNALQGFDAESEAVKIGAEDDKLSYRRNGIMSHRNAGDQFEPLTSRGRARDAMPRSAKEEITDHNRKLAVPKSGRSGKTLKSKDEDDLGLFTAKRKVLDCPSSTKCNAIYHINAAGTYSSDSNYSQTVFQNDNPKRKNKAHISDKDNDNNHGGSQCRRGNGRGSRCSQRTLVGYSLCEHHLGKSRFKSINSSEGLVPTTSKGSKFKKLHLIHDAPCKVNI